ncbi:MAG: hypothetical protein EOP34_05440 [Rickettsiales bacterium]|nr:MAG: hypothetical protein EOP34_05440 [Rickettsiales bacterium]
MESLTINSKLINKLTYDFEFSICTLVTRETEYQEMLQSFVDKGFNTDYCEYLHIDNTKGCTFEAFEGLNLFLQQAKGKYIIICHQDILLHKDGYPELQTCINTINKIDIKWAVCGNAGASGPNHIVYHVTYPDNKFMNKGKLPLKVSALDENFLLIKNSAHLRLSNNLKGFHLYATDLILQAELNGYSAYVIPFNLIHKSRGNKSNDFFIIRNELIKKYNFFFRSRWIQTNSTVFYLSGSPFRKLFGNFITLYFTRIINGIKKRV